MPDLFLIPFLSIFEVHDAAVKEWLNTLDDAALQQHLAYPFRLDRFFPEGSGPILISADRIHSDILHLMDLIDPQAVFFDISIDFIEYENKYNERLISPSEFWALYYEDAAADMREPSRTIYRIYIKDIINKNIRLIESKDHLPLSVVFYGLDMNSRKRLIPVYEKAFEMDGEFLLQAARTINEIGPFRVTPKHLWYSGMKVRHKAISYEETEKFYDELIIHLETRLTSKVRDYIVKSLGKSARDFLSAYEVFLDCKMKEDNMQVSRIIEGLDLLMMQSEYPLMVIFCGPMHYFGILDGLKRDQRLSDLGIKIRDVDMDALLNKMKPFIQKNRIMQRNYVLALNILGRKKPERFNRPGAILTPA